MKLLDFLRSSLHTFLWTRRLTIGRYYPRELDVLKEQITSTDICIDVGAHAGSWTYPLSKLCHRVYSFEALPYYAKVLQAALINLNATNVHVSNNAVSNECGTADLIWRNESGERLTGFTHLASSVPNPGTSLCISKITIDSFCDIHLQKDDRLKFLKCDVEGHELAVMRGAEKTLKTFHPIVFCESNDKMSRRYGSSSADLIRFMESFGYASAIIEESGVIKPVNDHTYSGRGDILFNPPSL